MTDKEKENRINKLQELLTKEKEKVNKSLAFIEDILLELKGLSELKIENTE